MAHSFTIGATTAAFEAGCSQKLQNWNQFWTRETGDKYIVAGLF